MLQSKTVDTLLSELRAATKLSKFYLTSYTLLLTCSDQRSQRQQCDIDAEASNV